MTHDELFDGSNAHLLPGNAELIRRLREYHDSDLEYGGFGVQEAVDAANALEAADKRIAELDAEVKHYMNAFDLAYNQAMKNGQAANEAERNYLDSVEVNTALQHGLYEKERKLDVAREFIRDTQSEYKEGTIGFIDCEDVLAQIGGNDEQT